MCQLSQLLEDQRTLLSSLAPNTTNMILPSSVECDAANVIEESKQKLIHLLENVEGATSLAKTRGRICLHQGSLLEMHMQYFKVELPLL